MTGQQADWRHELSFDAQGRCAGSVALGHLLRVYTAQHKQAPAPATVELEGGGEGVPPVGGRGLQVDAFTAVTILYTGCATDVCCRPTGVMWYDS